MVASAQGIDVSDWQGLVNWATAANGLTFAICRATEGLGGPGTASPDPWLAANWAGMRAAGLARGAYHFLHPALDGASQARYFVSVLRALPGGLQPSDMLMLDNETYGPSGVATSAVARAFMAELRSLCPHNPIAVYTYMSFAKAGYCQGLGGYPLWIAYPSSTPPSLTGTPWSSWAFWQWGVRGTDQDAFNGTAADFRKWLAAFNPVPPVNPPDPPTMEADVYSGQIPASNKVPVPVVKGSVTRVGLYCDVGLNGNTSQVVRVAVYSEAKSYSQIVNVTLTAARPQWVEFDEGDVEAVSFSRGAADGSASVGYFIA